MRIPSCECKWMPASSYVTVSGVDLNGLGFCWPQVNWICVNKNCEKYLQVIEPVWVEVGGFLPGAGLPPPRE